MKKFIKARFISQCAETGDTINIGDTILYDTTTKKAYCHLSDRYRAESENQSIADMVQAQEDAFYDNFCKNNNI